MPNKTVTFKGPITGAGIVITTAVTDANGNASAMVTANGSAGTYTVMGTVFGIPTPATFSLTNTVGTATTITATSGSGQSTDGSQRLCGAVSCDGD